MRVTTWIVIGALAAAAAGFGGYRLLRPEPVTLVAPTRGPAVDAVYATGVVEPSLEIRIAPRAAGRLIEILADEDDLVRKGQLLARLEDSDLKASVAELSAKAQYARAQYDRTVKLRKEMLVSADAVEKARADLDQAVAVLKRARDELSYMRLVAPADGRITRRDGEVGEFVPVNQIVFYMAGPEPLRITADVDEEDVPRIKTGLPVLIRTDAFPDRVFDGRVEQVTPRGDSVARSYRVRIKLMNDPPLQIGMTAETNIVLAKREKALLVPSSAVVDGVVWTIADGRAVPHKVRTGVVGTEETEVMDGLTGNERLIAVPPEGLETGDRVRVAG